MGALNRIGQPDGEGNTLDRLGQALRNASATLNSWYDASGLDNVRRAIDPNRVFGPSDVASFAPGGGLVNAWQDSGRARDNLKAGNYGQAAIDYGNMGLNLAGELPFAKLAMAMMPAAKKGITAFHGSPHDFDRFSMDKIGTGEGAQAYGHGLYFAENEDVAKGYRNALAPGMGDGALRAAGLGDADLRSLRQFTQSAVDPDIAMRDWLAWTGKKETPELRSAFMQEWQGRNPGKMYEVRINANPDHFLDWDKPLSEQSPKATAAMRQALDNRYGKGFFDEYAKQGNDFRDITQNFDDLNPAGVADLMREAGIPGIKYLDAGSRTAGEGSRNYVVFDDKLIEILKKYGWVPGMAIPAAAVYDYERQRGAANQPPEM